MKIRLHTIEDEHGKRLYQYYVGEHERFYPPHDIQLGLNSGRYTDIVTEHEIESKLEDHEPSVCETCGQIIQ